MDPRLASESASSLPQRLQCPGTQTMSNFFGTNDSGDGPLKSDNDWVGLVWVACGFH